MPLPQSTGASPPIQAPQASVNICVGGVRVRPVPSEQATRVIAVRVNPADIEWIDGIALVRDVTRSDVVRAAIAGYINNEENK